MKAHIHTLPSSTTLDPASRQSFDPPALTTVQRAALETLEQLLAASPVVALTGPKGMGKTTLVRSLAARRGGRLISPTEVYGAIEARPDGRWEEVVGALVVEALERSDLVILDDFLALKFLSWGERGSYWDAVVKHFCEAAADAGKHLVLVGTPLDLWGSSALAFDDHALLASVQPFGARDYAELAAGFLGAERIGGIDFSAVYRFAGTLQGHQLRLACRLLAPKPDPLDTDGFIECLKNYVVTHNVREQEVEPIAFDALPGAEAMLQELETAIVLPFENAAMADRLAIKPSRGVLLYGPPGTGKTSIGRALAHRLKSKFFLIDGSFITEPPTGFFAKVGKVVREAKEQAPSVLFIDDADVLFRIDHVAGLSRYLLSLLDGLESATAGQVCVMMTAMDVRKIPEALLRSGRVELWLETRLPDAATRARILGRWMGDALPGHEKIDYTALAEMTGHCTPADLRRITRDARALYAGDIAAERAIDTATGYIARAVSDLVATRDNMARLLGDDGLRIGSAAAA